MSRPGTVRQPVWIGVDVGGTKVLAAAVEGSRIVSTAHRDTPGRRVDVTVLEDALADAVAAAADGAPIAGVGVAAAGFVDAAGERVVFAPHLPWRGERVTERLAERFGAPVVLDNDANCHAAAEVAFGSAAGAQVAVMITLGTGIGGALVVSGRLLRGRHGLAGEFGHMQVVPGGQSCPCGLRGCWEQYCSGDALVRYVRDRFGDEPTLLTGWCDGDAARVTGPMVTEAAELGDPVAQAAFNYVGTWLGIGAANLVAAIDPDVIVVGGGVSAAGERLLGPARRALAQHLVAAEEREVAPLLGAALGPSAGVIGAAALARAGRGA